MLPKNRPPTHPGEILLQEFLTPMGLTQSEFAKHVGWTYARLNEIVNGKRGITANSALTLEDALGMEATFWLNLQQNWELWHASKRHHKVKLIKRKAA